MLRIIGNEIQLTRGDSAEIAVNLTDTAGIGYVLQESDVLTLSVKKHLHSTEYIFQKTVTGSNAIEIVPEDTKKHEYGKYIYDVQLTTSDGKVYTVIPLSDFVIREEVTE